MISTKSLLHGLAVLISLDIMMTLIMVGYMGGTELNAIASIVGFNCFVAIKIILSAVSVYAIYRYCIPSAPFAARYGTMMLGLVYGGLLASNAYQIVGAVA